MADRTVLVTGGSRGIGSEICRQLLTGGYRVIAVARNPTEEITELLDRHGHRLRFERADLCRAADLDRLCRLLRSTSSLFGLVNNAGTAIAGLHVTLDRDSMSRMLALNVYAPMALCQAAVRSMARRHAGRIVNISSVSAHRTFRGLGVYTATKTALEGFSRVLAVEAGHWGVTVNCVAPGYVETAMNAELSEQVRVRIVARNALPVAPRAADVASVVDFLLSPAADTLTAQVIRVDSGSAA